MASRPPHVSCYIARRIPHILVRRRDSGRCGEYPAVPRCLLKQQLTGRRQVPDADTGMEDEKHFVSQLVTFEEALEKLEASEDLVVDYAWNLYMHTLNQATAA